MSIHSPEQLRTKREAIDVAVVKFIQAFKSGALNDECTLIYEIESLNQVVVEYKRG